MQKTRRIFQSQIPYLGYTILIKQKLLGQCEFKVRKLFLQSIRFLALVYPLQKSNKPKFPKKAFNTPMYSAPPSSRIQWKYSHNIMIQKPVKPSQPPSSSRPISLLPGCSELLEKHLFKRFIPIIENSNLIRAHQFGFRRHHLTTSQSRPRHSLGLRT